MLKYKLEIFLNKIYFTFSGILIFLYIFNCIKLFLKLGQIYYNFKDFFRKELIVIL